MELKNSRTPRASRTPPPTDRRAGTRLADTRPAKKIKKRDAVGTRKSTTIAGNARPCSEKIAGLNDPTRTKGRRWPTKRNTRPASAKIVGVEIAIDTRERGLAGGGGTS